VKVNRLMGVSLTMSVQGGIEHLNLFWELSRMIMPLMSSQLAVLWESYTWVDHSFQAKTHKISYLKLSQFSVPLHNQIGPRVIAWPNSKELNFRN
jgi:hypothetical protein